MAVKIVQHKNVAELLVHCSALLKLHEAEDNNLIHLLHLIEEDSPIVSPPYWFGTVEVDGKPIGCCVHALPDGLVTTALPQIAANPLYDALVQDIPAPTRIVGTPGFAHAIALRYAQQGVNEARLSARWHVYRLDNISELPKSASGELTLGHKKDSPLVSRWARAYSEESPSFLNVMQFMLGKLDSGELYFWHDDEARAMVTISGRGMPAPRISSVFTPKEFRGRGYASQAVAAVCEAQRAAGAPYVVLTATHGGAAARIYQRLGFYPVGERHSYTILPEATADHPVY